MDGQHVREAVYDLGVAVRRLTAWSGGVRALLWVVALLGAWLAASAAAGVAQVLRGTEPGAVAAGALDMRGQLGTVRGALIIGVVVTALLGSPWLDRVHEWTVRIIIFGGPVSGRHNRMRGPARVFALLALVAFLAGHGLLIFGSGREVVLGGLGAISLSGLLIIATAFVVSEAVRFEAWRLRALTTLVHSSTGTPVEASELLVVLPHLRNGWPPFAVLLAAGLFLSLNGGTGSLSRVDCQEGLDRCDRVVVPLDWAAPGDGRTTTIAYGVLEPDGPPIGTLVVAVGGPGASGLSSATDYAANIDPEILRRYRVVLFDQRGIGDSGGLDCPRSVSGLDIGDGRTRSAELFAGRCLDEAGVDPADAGLYSTAHVVRDLEALRGQLGIDRFALYGVSYGTVVAQAYAERYPERLSAMILDAPVDRTLSSVEVWAAAAEGGDAVLERVFQACRANVDCAADVPDPARAYDELIDRFDGRPVDIRATDYLGAVRTWTLDRTQLEGLVFSLLYDPYGRMVLQRAIAAADRDDDATLGAMLIAGGIEPDERYPIADDGFSNFVSYAASCSDYRTSPSERQKDRPALLQAGEDAGVNRLRMASVFLAQVPCLYWPVQPATPERPAPLTTLPFPTVVLVSTTDPITPAAFGQAIAANLEDAYLVETTGGAHSTLWWGDPCVDEPIRDLLVEGTRPASREIRCVTEVSYPYYPLSPETRSGASALDLMLSLEYEIWGNPNFAYWNGVEELTVGCIRSGYYAVTEVGADLNFEFEKCEHVPGVVVDGEGSYAQARGATQLDVQIAGEDLSYRATPQSVRVTGTYQGRSVDEGL